jgi:hypothetical protein
VGGPGFNPYHRRKEGRKDRRERRKERKEGGKEGREIPLTSRVFLESSRMVKMWLLIYLK